jgi:hypothetical protein
MFAVVNVVADPFDNEVENCAESTTMKVKIIN